MFESSRIDSPDSTQPDFSQPDFTQPDSSQFDGKSKLFTLTLRLKGASRKIICVHVTLDEIT